MGLEIEGKRADAGRQIVGWRIKLSNHLEQVHNIYTDLNNLKVEFPADAVEIDSLKSAIIISLQNKATNLQGI